MPRHDFFALVSDQVRADLRAFPEKARTWVSGQAAVERCLSVADLRDLAEARLPRAVFDFVDGGASSELTVRRNREAFEELSLMPRVLAGVGEVDLSTTIFGERVAVPLFGAPTGRTGMVHPEAEVAVSRAVQAAGGVYVASSAASRTLVEIANASVDQMWLQIYLGRERSLARALLERAVDLGVKVLVVTVDTPRPGIRQRDLRNRFLAPYRVTAKTLLDGVRRPRWSRRFLSRPRLLTEGMLTDIAGAMDPTEMYQLIGRQFDPALSWQDIDWVREQWGGQLVLKGVLDARDARLAQEHGVNGVIVSNHGGRQLDGAIASVAALPAVVDAVAPDLEVFLDSGIRSGGDLAKALALGASACLCGRALVYGLGAGGELGARKAIALMLNELRLTMLLLGARNVSELGPELIRETSARQSLNL